MGYNGQTATVTTSTATTAPWTTSTATPTSSTSLISPAITNRDARESAGGGDYGYLTDYELVKTAIGTTVAYKPNTTTATYYWLASRKYNYDATTTPTKWEYLGRTVSTTGNPSSFQLYRYENSNWVWSINKGAVRPIVTLSASLNVTESTKNDKKLWTIN